MALTTIDDILGDHESILLDPSDPDAITVTGQLDADMPPGTWVVKDPANNYWVGLDSDNVPLASGSKVGVIGYKQRMKTSSFAERVNTDNYDISEPEGNFAPIHISGVVVALCDDQGGTVEIDADWMASSNEGYVTALALAATGATSGTALRQQSIAKNAMKVIDDDTVGIFRIGKSMNNGVNYSRTTMTVATL